MAEGKVVNFPVKPIEAAKCSRQKILPGYPSRENMVRAAIYMEQVGYDWSEWRAVARLCRASKAIRGFILSYVQDILDMWEGLEPHRGCFNYEIALIAADHAWTKAYQEMGCVPKERIRALLEPPAPWTQEEREAAWRNYQMRQSDNYRVTAKIMEALKREAMP